MGAPPPAGLVGTPPNPTTARFIDKVPLVPAAAVIIFALALLWHTTTSVISATAATSDEALCAAWSDAGSTYSSSQYSSDEGVVRHFAELARKHSSSPVRDEADVLLQRTDSGEADVSVFMSNTQQTKAICTR